MGAAIRYDKYRFTTMHAWDIPRCKAEFYYGITCPWMLTVITSMFLWFRAYFKEFVLDLNKFLHYHLLLISAILCLWAMIRSLPCQLKYKRKYNGCANLIDGNWYWIGSLILIVVLSVYQLIGNIVIFTIMDKVSSDPNSDYDEPSVAAMVLLTIFVTIQCIMYFYQLIQTAMASCSDKAIYSQQPYII